MEKVQFTRCAIFCIANIPPSVGVHLLVTLDHRNIAYHYWWKTIDRFIEETVQHLSAELRNMCGIEQIKPEEHFMLMTSKDVSALHHGLSTPVEPFESPFIGETIDEVAAWFTQNITDDSDRLGYMEELFVVLDTEAVEQGTCTIVQARDGDVQTLCSDFSLALLTVQNLDLNVEMEEW